MTHFLYKLLGPRPTFPMDITETEKALMVQHSTYWRAFFKDGSLLVLGPVYDPKGPYGIAILRVDEATANRLAQRDPAIRADVGFRYELSPMNAVTAETPG